MRTALGDVDAQIKEAKRLMDLFLSMKPSEEDKASVNLKLEKCQALYDAEGVVNIPLITHVASAVCFDELVDKLNELVNKYRRTPIPGAVAPTTSGFPTWGYVAIGAGALVGVGALAWALSPKPAKGK